MKNGQFLSTNSLHVFLLDLFQDSRDTLIPSRTIKVERHCIEKFDNLEKATITPIPLIVKAPLWDLLLFLFGFNILIHFAHQNNMSKQNFSQQITPLSTNHSVAPPPSHQPGCKERLPVAAASTTHATREVWIQVLHDNLK